LIESYHESLPKGRYPLAFVFFEIDPAAVDVNVHPSKREVRFRSETAVRGFVIRSVLARLRELSETTVPVVPVPQVDVTSPPFAMTRSVSLPAMVAPKLAPVAPAMMSTRAPAPSVTPMRPPSVAPVPAPAPTAPAWRFLGLAHGAYALFETKAGLVLLDRRAAHERIWFERLQAQFSEGTVPSQRLLLPLPLELDPIASSLLLDRLEFLNGHGFEVVEFGRNFFRIEGVPAWMEPADAEPFVRELLGALRDGQLQERKIDVAREQLARLAAARAVRLGDVASEAAMLALVAQLFACRSPLTSPGGTPTHIELSHGELARRFQR
ncbi:MAG: DNA mismatch repair protein MutL, partial [Rariglobus sp.]|nr:DNA mismatch repair protein MutL [Rariglobus sp.]